MKCLECHEEIKKIKGVRDYVVHELENDVKAVLHIKCYHPYIKNEMMFIENIVRDDP